MQYKVGVFNVIRIKGVRQGCNLSPLLFSLFMSGLGEELAHIDGGVILHDRKISLLMYADDIVLISNIQQDLVRHIQTLQHFCNKVKLEINVNKTKVCAIGKQRITNLNIAINDTQLEVATVYKYLGVVFTSNRKQTEVIELQVDQYKKVLNVLKNSFS